MFSETLAWVCDRIVWLRLTTLLRKCENAQTRVTRMHSHAHNHRCTHTILQTHTGAMCLWLFVVRVSRSQASVCASRYSASSHTHTCPHAHTSAPPGFASALAQLLERGGRGQRRELLGESALSHCRRVTRPLARANALSDSDRCFRHTQVRTPPPPARG